MSQIETIVEIDRPLEQVFEYLSDLRHMPEWAQGVVGSARLTPEPVGRGTVYRMTGRIAGRPSAMDIKVTEYQPGLMYASVTVMGPLVVDDRWEFAPAGTGTRVRQVADMHAPGLLAPLGWLAAALLGKRLGDDLRMAKRRLEADELATLVTSSQ